MEKLSQESSLAARAMEKIREEIVSGKLAPGTVISASEIAKRFGVSRTPVRDALLQLAQAGMVRIEKNRGATILATSLEDLVEVFQIRLMLEVPLAARAATLRSSAQLAEIESCFNEMKQSQNDHDRLLVLDRDFHLAIASAAGNERAVNTLSGLRNLVLTRGVGTTSTARTGEELVTDHAGIMSGLRTSDPELTASEMRRHIINTANLLITQEADGNPDYGEEWLKRNLNWL